jgi:uncharacterized repeat protein (TIGR01451 family)
MKKFNFFGEVELLPYAPCGDSMKTNPLTALLLLSLLVFPPFSNRFSDGPNHSSQASIQPVLKWSRGGCYSSWCETGWYSSPAVADLDGDGNAEVIGASYSLVVLDGRTGALRWRAKSGHDRDEPDAENVGRTWPGVAVADLDGNGDLEIVTAHSGGVLSVYSHQGYFEPGWPQQPAPGSELRSMGLADLEGDGDLEVLAAATRSQDQWFAYEHTGVPRAGSWPQHNPDSDTNGYTAGCYNQNLAAGDLDGDGRAEIVGPNDTHYLAAFEDDGRQVRASSTYGMNDDGSAKVWSRVGVHVDQAVDLRGYANCGQEHRPNFANSAPLVVDVNYDGTAEAVVVGNVYNCGADPYASLYEIPYILKGDRSRWKAGPYDWTALPAPQASSGPLSEDWNRIESSLPNPAAADLDADGSLEILYPSYDGRLHAYWLDKTERGAWPYSVYRAGEGFFRFASEPAVADLDGDGLAEVIFISWTEKNSGRTGYLHILSHLGTSLAEVSLPPVPAGQTWEGALAAPTLADIDGDPDLEVVVNTAHNGLAAYDLPGTAQAVVLWGTGRGSYLRNGSLAQGNLFGSQLQVNRSLAQPGERLAYTLTLRNPGPALSAASVRAPLPAGTVFAGNLSASSGTIEEQDGVITWSGQVSAGAPVTLGWEAELLPGAPASAAVVAAVEIETGQGAALQRQAVTWVNGLVQYLPLLSAP